MKTRLFIVLSLLIATVLCLSAESQDKNYKTIIGRLYSEHEYDSIFVVLPEFIERTEVGSPEWEEMERWTPHAAFFIARSGKPKSERMEWSNRADSLWGAIDKRRGLGTGEKYARMEVWQVLGKFQEIIDQVRVEEKLQSKTYIMDKYFDARIRVADTTGFIDELASSVLRGSKEEDMLLLRYYELSENNEAAIACYEKHLTEKPDSKSPGMIIYWTKKYALFLTKQGDYTEALEKINMAIKENESYHFPFFDYHLFAIRGTIYHHLGRFEEAKADSTFYLSYKKRANAAMDYPIR